MPKKLKILMLILACFSFIFLQVTTAQAQSFLPACVVEGYCSLCDMLQLVINFGKFLLGLVGSLALLMFVYGGFVWLTSGGEGGKIDLGKKILINSVIGIGITFFAWVVVAFVVNVLTASTGWKWDIELTCAKLPGLPEVQLENRDIAVSNKTEGSPCTSTSECDSTLFCTKDTKKCTKKIQSSTEEKPEFVCKDKEISGQDNLACESGNCAGTLGGIFKTDCVGGQCCGSKEDVQPAGEKCDKDKKCNPSLYCKPDAEGSLTGSCQKKLPFKSKCFEKDIIGDIDDMCESGDCSTNICAPEAGQGVEGSVCTEPWDCWPPCGYYVGATAVIPFTAFWGNVAGSTIDPICLDNMLFCWEWGDNRDDDRGICTKRTSMANKKCEDALIVPLNNPNAPCPDNYQCGTWEPTPTTVDTCIPK